MPMEKKTCKKKESTLPMAEATFEKYVYGRQQKHPILYHQFDSRPEKYRETAPALLEEFLEKVKGKGLGVPLLKDKDTQA